MHRVTTYPAHRPVLDQGLGGVGDVGELRPGAAHHLRVGQIQGGDEAAEYISRHGAHGIRR